MTGSLYHPTLFPHFSHPHPHPWQPRSVLRIYELVSGFDWFVWGFSISQMRSYSVCVTDFSWQAVLKFRPCCCKQQGSSSWLSGVPLCACASDRNTFNPLARACALGLFPGLATVTKAAVNTGCSLEEELLGLKAVPLLIFQCVVASRAPPTGESGLQPRHMP